MGAFQSGTDKENEENQDGLHITVGNMDKAQYDIHARFYRKTMKFEKTLNLALFFDIGDVLSSWPQLFLDYMPKDLETKTAIKLMGKPVTVEFPEQWKTNLIVKPAPPAVVTPASIPQSRGSDFYSSDFHPTWQRANNAWKEIVAKAVARDIAHTDITDAIQDMGLEGFAYNILLGACLHHKVDLDDLVRQSPMNLELDMAELMAKNELADEQAKKNPKSGTGNGTGIPNSDDDAQWRLYCGQ